MKLSDLKAEWTKDAKFNALDLGGEAENIGNLHAKYLGHLVQYKLQLRKAESELIRLRRDKRSWMMGEMSREVLTFRQWEPYLKSKPLVSHIDRVIGDEEDVIKLTNKVDYLKTAVNAVEYIMKSIGSRGWDVKNKLDFEKFKMGF